MRFFFCMAKVIIGAMPDKKVKKILIFSLAYYPHVGGAEVAVKEITDRITGIEFHMVTMRMDSSPRESLEGRVHVYRIGLGNKSRLNKFLFQFLAAHKASKLHKHYHYDAIWALMAHSAGMPAVLFKMKHKEVPYLLNLQEGDPPAYIERTMRPLWPLFIAAFRRADVVQPISTFLAAWARKMGYTGPIEIIPNGVDVKRFSGIPVAHKGIILITSPRLVHKNAVDDVIRALALLPSHARFQILGIGPEENMLRELAKKEGVSERVEFLGHIDHKDMPRYLHAADIFVRPSRSEGQGASFMETMTAGLPVIATQEGGIADFLFDAKRNHDEETTGWAVDKDSPEQIAEAVKNILAHPEDVAKVTATAKKLATEKYDWNLIAIRMRAVFERLFRDA